MKPSQRCAVVCSVVHITVRRGRLLCGLGGERQMLTRRDATDKAGADDRPFNNVLRRLSEADYALVAPCLMLDDSRPGDLLYSPGDDVETVHFPCGPAL